jgi:hypothetical protein
MTRGYTMSIKIEKAGYTKLTMVQKRFVVRALARWNGPTQTAKMLEQEYGLVLDRQSISKYDPTTDCGSGLSPVLRKLFFTTREQFVKHHEQEPMSHLSVRLHRWEQLYQEARDNGQPKLAARVLSDADKSMKTMDYSPEDDPDDGQDGDASEMRGEHEGDE